MHELLPRRTPAIGRAVRELRAGRPEAAIEALREAFLREPASAGLAHDFGLACLETDRLDEAIAAFRQAVALRPDYMDAHFRLGLALERSGDPRGAVLAYDRTTALLPSHAEAWLRAGSLVFTLGHRAEAIGCFRRAASAGRAGSIGRLGLARALLAEARDAQAERVLRHLLARSPDNQAAQDLLGNLLADAGRFAEAREWFARAVAAGPAMAGSYYDLVRCRRLTADDAGLLPSMRTALGCTPPLAEARIRLHLAIGKAEDDLGNPQAAWRHFDAADATRARLVEFDADAFDHACDRLIQSLPGDGPTRLPRDGRPGARSGPDPRPTPILIVGMPRSGTTLMEQILSCHGEVGAAGELNFWSERGPGLLAAADRPGDARPDPCGVADDYLALLAATSPGRAYVTDKMPFNFLWAGLIHLACPDAIVLHCRRSPIDTAVSIHQTLFNPRLAFPTGGTALVRCMRSYERVVAHWRRVLPPERFVEFDYETLTADPEATIRAILSACGLDWQDACLHPDRNPLPVRTPSRWQTRQPINRDAVARWRRYAPWLGPLGVLAEDREPAGG